MKVKPKNQARQKLLNYLVDFINSDNFQKQITEIRKRFGIPMSGYPVGPKDEEAIKNLKIFYFPEGFTKEKSRDVKIGLRKMISKFPVSGYKITFGFFIYLVHNIVKTELFEEEFLLNNLCNLVDMKEFISEREGMPEIIEKDMQEMTTKHPIALFIRPEATQRDIVDYVKEVWAYIEIYKCKYLDKKSKVGKIKRKDEKIKERNDFIYKNRHLPRKEIMRMITDTFDEIIDYGHIGKIISLEIKKRKEM